MESIKKKKQIVAFKNNSQLIQKHNMSITDGFKLSINQTNDSLISNNVTSSFILLNPTNDVFKSPADLNSSSRPTSQSQKNT